MDSEVERLPYEGTFRAAVRFCRPTGPGTVARFGIHPPSILSNIPLVFIPESPSLVGSAECNTGVISLDQLSVLHL